MILHAVFFKLKSDAKIHAIDELNAAIAKLQDVIPGITSYHWGPSCSPEGLEKGFDAGFIMTFVNGAARDAYLPHPEHMAVQPMMHALVDDAFVYDFDL